MDEIDTEFKLKEIDLEAEYDANAAEAEAAYQKKLAELFLTPGVTFDQVTIEKLQADGKAYADELFRSKNNPQKR
ncbi:MAG: hypothetical protein KJ950_07695 [Proteobacteria bacterium]|nr:hypothetical protein [Pseudomonadota bacterium]MBU1687240.1 hypothetical protein [Pseudomonadota bacterium]